MERIASYFPLIDAVANMFTIVASILAIYIFLVNRKSISIAIRLLVNYSFQTTLTELKEKLERLNEYNANEPAHHPEIRNILHEIAGQINGNDRLSKAAPHIAGKVQAVAQSKKLQETARRAIVSEVREQLRNIQIRELGTFGDSRHE